MATPTPGTERTIGQLVADATHDLEGIVRGEIALAKAEVTSGAKVIGKGVGLLAGAGFLVLMGVVFLLHSAAWGIAEWLPVWAGYLIVAVVILIVGAVLGLLGKKALDNAKPAPERAIDQAQQTLAVIKEPFADSDAVDGAAVPRHPARRPGGPGTAAGRLPPAPRAVACTAGAHRVHDSVSLTRTARRHRPGGLHPLAQHRADLIEGQARSRCLGRRARWRTPCRPPRPRGR